MGFLTAAHKDRARRPACLGGTGGVYNCDVAGTVIPVDGQTPHASDSRA